MVGDVYLGRVEAVLPGIQAAFVDIGTEKSAFLHSSDLVVPDDDEGDDDADDDEEEREESPDRPSRGRTKGPPIQDVLKRGPDACPVGRVPAAEIEGAVVDQLRGIFRQPEIIVGTWRAARAEQDDITEDDVREALQQLDPLWDELFPAEGARIVTSSSAMRARRVRAERSIQRSSRDVRPSMASPTACAASVKRPCEV